MSNRLNLRHSKSHAMMWLTILSIAIAFIGVASYTSQTSIAWAEETAEDNKATDGADDGAADNGADDKADGGAGEEKNDRSFLGWLIDSSGVFGIVLLLLSFVMVALIMMNVLQCRREILMPGIFMEEFEEKLTQKDYQGAYDSARGDDSLLARVLAAGLGKLNRGYSEAIEGMQEVGEEENMALEHRLSYLALIGSVAPMIGLMGTVYGMIQSFDKIANSTTSPKPAELAEGISMALFTTLEGLLVAIPAMVAYSILRNRVSRFMLEVGISSESLMSRFAVSGKTKPSGGAAPAGAPAAPKQ